MQAMESDCKTESTDRKGIAMRGLDRSHLAADCVAHLGISLLRRSGEKPCLN